MAKIFSPPKEVGEPPTFDHTKSFDVHRQKEDKYIEKVCQWAKTHGSGPNRGEIVSFPVADGYAMYVIYKPTQLIHLAVGDAWQYAYAKLLTAKAIAEEVRRAKALNELFSRKPA